MFARPGTSALASTKWIQTRMYHLFYPPNNGVGLVAYLAFFGIAFIIVVAFWNKALASCRMVLLKNFSYMAEKGICVLRFL